MRDCGFDLVGSEQETMVGCFEHCNGPSDSKFSKEFFDQLSKCYFSVTMLGGIRWFVGSFYCFYLMKTQM